MAQKYPFTGAYLEGAEPARAPLNAANIRPRHGWCVHSA